MLGDFVIICGKPKPKLSTSKLHDAVFWVVAALSVYFWPVVAIPVLLIAAVLFG